MEKFKENKTEIIKFRVTKTEYKEIEKCAVQHGKSLTAYAKEYTLNPYSLSVNYDEIEEHTKQITEIKQAVNLLIGTLVKSGNYYPNDVENLLKSANEIVESEKNLIKLFRKNETKLRKELEKIVSENSRKAVKKQ